MNAKTETEIKATNAADVPANQPAAVEQEEDWLAGFTPQASCNLDGTCESCQ